MARAIMIQGTGSNVGKSLIVAGLARAFFKRGLRVAPFKPQNMSNNAAVTAQGGEIGRAQALQARAAGIPPTVDMNPVLLKPETETGAQLVVRGARVGRQDAADYQRDKGALLAQVLDSFGTLCADFDLVLIEGAGSPAETNLRRGDIANMGFACTAGVPVILVGDIDRGGVIAQIVGTQAVLDDADRAQIVGFAVNRFRGDLRLFDDGRDDISRRTGWPCLGVVPWFQNAWRLPAEDMMDLGDHPIHKDGSVRIVVPQLPRMANFDDLDPLSNETGVRLDIVPPGRALPGDADLVLIPGSKSTRADLTFLRAQGWDIDIHAHVRRGGQVLGLCGGYQMLGQQISDPNGVDGPPGTDPGLGLLDVTTVMSDAKQVSQRQATALPGGEPVTGYEIHMGRTHGPDCSRGWLSINGRIEGATSPNGQVRGSYLHGVFSSDPFRTRFLAGFGLQSTLGYDADVDATLDALADHLEAHLDLDHLLTLATEPHQADG